MPHKEDLLWCSWTEGVQRDEMVFAGGYRHDDSSLPTRTSRSGLELQHSREETAVTSSSGNATNVGFGIGVIPIGSHMDTRQTSR